MVRNCKLLPRGFAYLRVRTGREAWVGLNAFKLGACPVGERLNLSLHVPIGTVINSCGKKKDAGVYA